MYTHIKKLWPFFALICLILLVYLTNIHHELTLENIRQKQMVLKAFVKTHPILSPLVFLIIYITSVCLVIPDSIILTLIAGLVFPLPLAVTYSVLSETIGAIIFFAIFRSAFGDPFVQKRQHFFDKMRQKFRDHSASYMLFLRLSHIIPFWLINIAAAYFKVTYKTFIWTTLVGIFPLTYVLSEAGRNLSKLFATHTHLSLGDIFNTEIKILLFIAGLLALLPLAIKKLIELRKQ